MSQYSEERNIQAWMNERDKVHEEPDATDGAKEPNSPNPIINNTGCFEVQEEEEEEYETEIEWVSKRKRTW